MRDGRYRDRPFVRGVICRASPRPVGQKFRHGDFALVEDEMGHAAESVRLGREQGPARDCFYAKPFAAFEDFPDGGLLDQHGADKDIVGPF